MSFIDHKGWRLLGHCLVVKEFGGYLLMDTLLRSSSAVKHLSICLCCQMYQPWVRLVLQPTKMWWGFVQKGNMGPLQARDWDLWERAGHHMWPWWWSSVCLIPCSRSCSMWVSTFQCSPTTSSSPDWLVLFARYVFLFPSWGLLLPTWSLGRRDQILHQSQLQLGSTSCLLLIDSVRHGQPQLGTFVIFYLTGDW